DREVIAELRGVIDDKGRSPFWDGLGRHFFQVDFPIADILSSSDKQFIAELMPTHPIYVPLLPKAAQAVIGKVHPQTEPARKLLESEGFAFSKMIDIFDGGPCVRCDRKAIRTIVESTDCELLGTDDPYGVDPHGAVTIDSLVATADGEFRCIGCVTRRTEGSVFLRRDDAERLQVQVGDRLIVSPLRGSAKEFWRGHRTPTEQSQ
ncbi:MAG: arginine N-succinyltransferase, partial [Planctomycetales bacterium]|nr:arginine N-succinyltransferase [Planctomycetales bacterium]